MRSTGRSIKCQAQRSKQIEGSAIDLTYEGLRDQRVGMVGEGSDLGLCATTCHSFHGT